MEKPVAKRRIKPTFPTVTSPTNPQTLQPRGQKHLKLMLNQISELQTKISELKQKQGRKQLLQCKSQDLLKVPDLPQRVIQKQIIQQVQKVIERQVVIEQQQLVQKIIERRVEQPKEYFTEKVMVRPSEPPEEKVVEVVEEREVVKQVVAEVDEALLRRLAQQTRKKMMLERELADNRGVIQRMKAELMGLRQMHV